MPTVNVIHINGGYFTFNIPALCIFYHTRIPRILPVYTEGDSGTKTDKTQIIKNISNIPIFHSNPPSSHARTCRIPSLDGRQKSSSETTSFS